MCLSSHERSTIRFVIMSKCSCGTMDLLSSDLLMNTISYLNVIDSSSLSSSSRRMYYLTSQFRRFLGPQLSTSSSSLAWENQQRRPIDNYKHCLSGMRTKPNFALTFTGETGNELCSHLNDVAPDGLVTLGASASGIQANCEGRVEHDIDAALMLGNFPPERTKILPFCFETFACYESSTMPGRLAAATPPGEHARSFWKVFIVYACGNGYYSVDNFVSLLQNNHPDSTIVGGICESGFVSMEVTKEFLATKRKKDLEVLFASHGCGSIEEGVGYEALLDQIFGALQKRKYIVEDVDNAIFGIALGGDVPVRSVVSRGVKSVTGGAADADQPSRWVVEDVEFSCPGDPTYMFQGDPEMLKPTHVIKSVRDVESGKVLSPLAMMASVRQRQPEFVGLRRPDTDGYELHALSPFSIQANSIVLMTDGTPEQELSIQSANIDLFVLDAKACNDHMDRTLELLKAATIDEVILGGLMFSCSGRGPEKRSMLREEMADARRFHKHFPDINLCGFYAGGEIGPMAMAGKRDVFQSGKAAVQGFTAVFALLIVPVVKPGAFDIDDSPENILKYMRKALQVG